MRISKIFKIAGLIVVLGLAGFYLQIRPKYVVPILMYHRIDQNGDSSSLSVSPENFRRRMQFLSRHNYNVISLSEFVQAKSKNKSLTRNTVVITFDDGYADNYLTAYPVLKQYGLAATIFVIVDAIGREGYLNYPQIEEMSASGIVEIGSHSLSGGYLPGRNIEEVEREIRLSKTILEERLNKPVVLFCYPIGGFSPEIQEIVQGCGYQAACSTNRGRLKTYTNDDLYALKRIKVTDDWPNLLVFWVKLSGYYNLFRRVRGPY